MMRSRGVGRVNDVAVGRGSGALSDGFRGARALVTRLRSSVYAMLLGRALFAGCALVLLAFVGSRFERPSSEAASTDDASVLTTSLFPSAQAAEVVQDAGVVVEPPTSARSTETAGPPTGGRATPESPVYVNQASEADLRRLPGVGAKRAEAILALRKRLGRFRRLEDLMRVKGIGRAAVRKWRPLVRLDDPAPQGDGGT